MIAQTYGLGEEDKKSMQNICGQTSWQAFTQNTEKYVRQSIKIDVGKVGY
jgi:hypothetical protein